MAKVMLKIPEEHAERIEKFLSEKGYKAEEALPLLVEYGLGCLDPLEMKRLNDEKELEHIKIGTDYSILRFEAYQYFMDNKAMTMQLRLMLADNRRLKEKLREEGLGQMPECEWDEWGEDEIKAFYDRYVFARRE